MPRTTPAYDDARRDQILQAAYRCFSENGLRSTTMQAVADEAGLSVGALYRYFDGKEALFAALAVGASETRRGAFERLAGEPELSGLAALVCDMMEALDCPEAIRSVRLDIRLWAEALDDARLARAVGSALADIREPVAALVAKAQARLPAETAVPQHPRDAAERSTAEGDAGRGARSLDPDAVGRVVISLLVGLELQRAHDPDLDLDGYRDAVRAVLGSLEGG